jgi:hypothetical protein
MIVIIAVPVGNIIEICETEDLEPIVVARKPNLNLAVLSHKPNIGG